MKRVDFIFTAALLLLATMLFVSYQIRIRLADSNRWTAHTYYVISNLDDLQTSLLEAESARRAYVLTGNRQYTVQFHFSTDKVTAVVGKLRQLTTDNKGQQQRLARLSPLIDRKLALLTSSVEAMEKEGYRPAPQARITEVGAMVMSLVVSEIIQMKDAEEDLLRERRTAEQTGVFYLLVAVWGGILAAMAILSLTYLVARREAVNQQRMAGALESSNRDIRNLSEMTQFMQSCSTLEEANGIVSRYGARLFQGDFGGVFLLNASKNLVIEAAAWGGAHPDHFTPDQCWGLRLGQPHVVLGEADVRCPHATADAHASICIPLAAQHETMGVLHIGLTAPGGIAAIKEKEQMAATFAEQVALALRNLLLREQLRELSIRDPLTGLLNRRYMEEVMQKELARALRQKLPICLIMLDVDHFKNFNDTFGHEAGDLVLKEFGHLLKSVTRVSDLACRLGGEEFVLILPEADKEAALEKAQLILEGLRRLQLVSGKQPLGRVTASAGIAVFPEDGDTLQHLMAVADAALYRAKANGRDRVETR